MKTTVYREVANGLIISVRVTPKSSKDEVSGLYEAADGMAAIAVKVSAPPDKGEANRAVIEVLAEALNVPKSSLAIVSGKTSRIKSILIKGMPHELAPAVEQLVQGSKG